MNRIVIILLFFLSVSRAQKFEVSGSISDKETNKPLSYANIRIEGTSNGTASNYDGHYIFKLSPGRYKLIFSYIGYKSEAIPVNVRANSRIDVELQPDPIKLGEVVVNAGENPAYRIIREAIKRKKENRKGLNNLEYNAYSKMIIKSAGEVAAIEETFVKGYNKIGNWEKEFILSTRKTENQQKRNSSISFNFTDRYYSDFSRDTLTVIMNKIFLPLADDAFDYYDYELLGVTESPTGDIYKIKVIPLSSIQPLVRGEITIENTMYALNSVNLEINEGVRFPFVNNLSVKYVQQLGKYNGYWFPNYVESSTSFEINFQGLIGAEKMEFNSLNSISEYKINGVIPDSINHAVKSRYGGYTSDTTGHERVPFYLSKEDINEMRPIPLTATEVEAYKNLDSSKTLEKMIKVKGALAGLIPESGTETSHGKSALSIGLDLATKYLALGNNRVNGFVFGPHYNGFLIKNKLELDISGGYAVKRKKIQGELNFNYLVKNSFMDGVEVHIFHTVRPWQKLTPYTEFYNSIGVTAGFDDQFNYYLSTGFELGVNKRINKSISAELNFLSEKEKSLQENNYQSIFNARRKPRVNPIITEGNDRRLSAKILFGKNPFEIQIIPADGLCAQVDFSNPAFTSNFNYKRVSIIGLINIKTFFKELFIAPYLQLLIDAGIVTGNYGQQHLLSPATAMGFYSPTGVIKGMNPYSYSGTEMIALHAEHNWRTTPFQALGLNFISDLHLDFITGVSVFKTWNNSSYTTGPEMKKPYWEIYAGISRILGALKINVGYNSQKNISITAAVGSIL